jgi:hypothetical protein
MVSVCNNLRHSSVTTTKEYVQYMLLWREMTNISSHTCKEIKLPSLRGEKRPSPLGAALRARRVGDERGRVQLLIFVSEH